MFRAPGYTAGLPRVSLCGRALFQCSLMTKKGEKRPHEQQAPRCSAWVCACCRHAPDMYNCHPCCPPTSNIPTYWKCRRCLLRLGCACCASQAQHQGEADCGRDREQEGGVWRKQGAPAPELARRTPQCLGSAVPTKQSSTPGRGAGSSETGMRRPASRGLRSLLLLHARGRMRSPRTSRPARRTTFLTRRWMTSRPAATSAGAWSLRATTSSGPR